MTIRPVPNALPTHADRLRISSLQYRGTDPLLFGASQALADAIAATRELEARALKARARQHLQERLRGGAAAGPAPCAADDTPCRVADRLYVGARLPLPL